MAKLASYFAPCISVSPEFYGSVVNTEDFRLHRRAWEVSTFDLATLATKHKLHIPYQLMDVFLNGPSHLEIEVSNSPSRDEAITRLEYFRATL